MTDIYVHLPDKIVSPGLVVGPPRLTNQSAIAAHVVVGLHPGRSTPGTGKHLHASLAHWSGLLDERNLGRTAEHSVLPPSVVDGHSRNTLYYYFIIYPTACLSFITLTDWLKSESEKPLFSALLMRKNTMSFLPTVFSYTVHIVKKYKCLLLVWLPFSTIISFRPSLEWF